MVPLKRFMTALGCGVVLCSVVTSHAMVIYNGLSANALSANALTYNALSLNGLPAGEAAPVEGPREGLPFTVITQKALGKTHP
jgi:hypothetical protein